MICLNSRVPERLTVKNIVAMLTIKRIPDSEIIKSIFDQTGKTTTVSNLTRIKQRSNEIPINGIKLCVKVNTNTSTNSGASERNNVITKEASSDYRFKRT